MNSQAAVKRKFTKFLREYEQKLQQQRREELDAPRRNFIASACTSGFTKKQAEFLWANRPMPGIMLSGPAWCSRYPNSSDPETLAEPFRSNVRRFLDALKQAGATVTISATRRSAERQYLMRGAWTIARDCLSPEAVPPMAGVDIQWSHPDDPNEPDSDPSVIAAEAMVKAYGIVFKPALTSRHIEGLAIDMDIKWWGDLTIPWSDGRNHVIVSAPRGGANTDLHAVGASYGVIKLVSDPPHWSIDGH